MMIPDGTSTTRRIHDCSGKVRQPAQRPQVKPQQPERLQNSRQTAEPPKVKYTGRSSGRPTGMRNVRPRIVELLVSELFDLACQGVLPRETAARRPKCHIRQISMYLCRVVLSMPYQKIANGLDRDRATVIHGCAVVEDRRDNPAYDGFVERCERCVRAIFQAAGEENVHAVE